MLISLHLSPQSKGEEDDLELLDHVVRSARAADAAGFASICLTEHHFNGFNTYSDPFMVGAHLAGSLEQAYIAITVVQVALHHPVTIAEHSNLLDLLTRGRCLIGLAAGSASPLELGGFDVDPAERSERTRQRVEAIVKAWSHRPDDPPLDLSTDFERSVLPGRLAPSSFRKPHPLAARVTYTPATIEDAARRGWPVLLGAYEPERAREHVDLYRTALESAGHSEETIADCLSWIGFVTHVSVASTVEEAEARVERFVEVSGTGPTDGRDGIPWAEEWVQRQEIRAAHMIAGTPEVVAERLLSFRDSGANHARIGVVVPSGELSEAEETLRHFIEEALPLLEPEQLPRPHDTAVASPA